VKAWVESTQISGFLLWMFNVSSVIGRNSGSLGVELAGVESDRFLEKTVGFDMLAPELGFGGAGIVAVERKPLVGEGAGLRPGVRFTNLAQTPPLDQAILQS
jgi:hypothetical protein